MKKIIYSILLICIVVMFTACSKPGNIVDNSTDDPIILLTCSQSNNDKRIWAGEIDNAFESNNYITKTTYLYDYGATVELLWNEEHNGKFLLAMFEQILSLPVKDGKERLVSDWEFYIFGKYSEILCVRNESGINSSDELISEILNDNIVIASSTGHSELCAKLLLNLIDKDDKDLLIIPENHEGAPLEHINDKIEAVITTPNNISQLVEDGTWIPVCVFSEEKYENNSFGNVPSITEVVPEFEKYLPMDRLFGVAIPFDTDEEGKVFVSNQILLQYDSSKYNEFFEEYYIASDFLVGNEARELCTEIQSNMCWALYEIGEAEYSPADFAIPRP